MYNHVYKIRGCPKAIVSDSKTVFKSYQNQLFFAERGIIWQLNLEGAALRGGFWERLKGMLKSFLKKSVGWKKCNLQSW